MDSLKKEHQNVNYYRKLPIYDFFFIGTFLLKRN